MKKTEKIFRNIPEGLLRMDEEIIKKHIFQIKTA